MLTVGPLTLVGEPRPASLETWSKSALLARETVPAELLEVLDQWGPGRLGGTFELPDPTGDGWATLRQRALGWHRRGYWTGLPSDQFERLSFLARDHRGAGLAYGDGGYVFLGPRGEVLSVGRKLDELVEQFICNSLHLTYDVRSGGALDTFVELGGEGVYVSSAAPGVAEYILALQSNAGDDLLPSVLSSEPLILAYIHTVAALCSPAADKIEESVREEALDTVVSLAKRRAPDLFELIFPRQLRSRAPLRDETVRAWSTSNLELSPEGPFRKEPLPGIEVAIARSLRREEYWEYVDADEWLGNVTRLWQGTLLEAVANDFAQAARAMTVDARLGIVRQIAQLDDYWTHVASRGGGSLAFDRSRERAGAAEVRLRSVVADARPLLALAAMGDREAVCIRATRLLSGVTDRALGDFWLRLLLSTNAPMPWGADIWTFAENYAASVPAPDGLVDRCLPALRKRSPIAAILVSSRIDRDDVLSALLEQYPLVATAAAYPPLEGRSHLTKEDPLMVEAVLGHLGLEAGARRRSLSEPGFRADGARRCLPARYFCENGLGMYPAPYIPPALEKPRRLGRPGPVTRALIMRPEKRTMDVLRKTADSAKTPIEVRDEAVKGLLQMHAPGASEMYAKVEAAWERYWHI